MELTNGERGQLKSFGSAANVESSEIIKMKKYKIIYRLDVTYDEPVHRADVELLLSPCHNESQKVRRFDIHSSVGPTINNSYNLFGFLVTYLRISEPFESFSLEIEAIVHKKKSKPHIYELLLSPKEEIDILNSLAFKVEFHLYVFCAQPMLISNEHAEIPEIFSSNEPLINKFVQLSTYLSQTIFFDPTISAEELNPGKVLEIKRGVFEDFTSIFITIARNYGVPARYVSGYLVSEDQAQIICWAELFIPGIGWKGFDPTNNVFPNHDYIKIAHGIEYIDCIPIKGTLDLEVGNETSYSLAIEALGNQ